MLACCKVDGRASLGTHHQGVSDGILNFRMDLFWPGFSIPRSNSCCALSDTDAPSAVWAVFQSLPSTVQPKL